MTTHRISYKVHGKVQGVNFRNWTHQTASGLGVTGWVSNTSDNKVVGEAQGSDTAIQSFLQDLNKGPSAAHVVKVEKESIEPKQDEGSFDVR